MTFGGGWTVADCVAAQAIASPDTIAIEVLSPKTDGVVPIETWSYGDLWARVEALAMALTDVPVGPHGPMVAIMMPNSVDHLVAYLACQQAGVAAVPINNRLVGPEVAFILRDSGAQVVLASDEFPEVVSAVSGAGDVRVVDTADVDRHAPTTWSGPAGNEADDRTALVAYTSGTTGFPKGSVVSNAGLLTRFAQWSWTFGLHPAQVLSTPGPVFHMSYGGLSLAHLAAGGRNRLMTDFDPAAALVEYAEHSTWAFLVPSMTTMIAEAWERSERPALGALEWMLSSGAPGPMSLLARAFDLFPNANIAEAYGWTEGGWVTFEVKQRDALVAHSVGRPVLGTEVVVRTDDGKPCSVGEPGEVMARSITPFGGYLGNEGATATSMTDDGFCRSGDVGIFDADGRLLIVDRVKDMIITGGENVYCAEVERVLLDHPSVAEAAVVGLSDERWGERVTAVLVASGELEADDVDTHCRSRLAAYKCPRQVEIVADLPRNPMGKVQKFKLIEEFEPTQTDEAESATQN